MTQTCGKFDTFFSAARFDSSHQSIYHYKARQKAKEREHRFDTCPIACGWKRLHCLGGSVYIAWVEASVECQRCQAVSVCVTISGLKSANAFVLQDIKHVENKSSLHFV